MCAPSTQFSGSLSGSNLIDQPDMPFLQHFFSHSLFPGVDDQTSRSRLLRCSSQSSGHWAHKTTADEFALQEIHDCQIIATLLCESYGVQAERLVHHLDDAYHRQENHPRGRYRGDG